MEQPNRLQRADEIMEIQRQKNLELAEQHERAKVKNITLRVAIDESIAALQWVMNELVYSPQKSLEGIMDGREQRLRGIGFLLIFFSSALLIIDGIVA